jgi:murein DD-endopeptidase MepM/ murein hydrolase activator NlpD
MILLSGNGAAPFSDNCSTLLNIPLKQNEKGLGRFAAGSFSLLQKIPVLPPLSEYHCNLVVKIRSEVASLKLEKSKSGKKNKGFYIALGVCLIAIGAAAWTTYDSVMNYSSPHSAQSEAAKTNKTVSGVFVNESSTPASSKPVSSTPTVSSQKPVSSSPASKVQVKTTVANPSSFSLPVSGKVLQSFSKKPVYNKTLGDYRAHTGVDLSAKTGEEVKSIAAGTVASIQNGGEFGNTVTVKYGSVEASYCGLNQISVKKQQKIAQGQRIGTVGVNPTEAEEGPHLHLVLKQDGQYIDPMSILK